MAGNLSSVSHLGACVERKKALPSFKSKGSFHAQLPWPHRRRACVGSLQVGLPVRSMERVMRGVHLGSGPRSSPSCGVRSGNRMYSFGIKHEAMKTD